MAPILNRSPLTSISFKDESGSHIRVYYQDSQGNIRETFYDDDNGWERRSKDIVGKGKLNTGIAAIGWDKGKQIRVYFLSPENQIVERCYTGGGAGSWFDGSLTTKSKYNAAPYSQLGAVGFGDGLKDCRVYYQEAESNKIRELVLRVDAEEWTRGSASLPDAVPGSDIEAIATTPDSDFATWVYYQQSNMKLVEYKAGSGGHWSKGNFRAEGVYPPGASIGAVIWGEYEIRVLAVDERNELTATAYSGGWGKTERLGPLIPRSDVTLVTLPTSGWIRAYCQPVGSAITEKGSNDGGTTFETMEDTLPTERGD